MMILKEGNCSGTALNSYILKHAAERCPDWALSKVLAVWNKHSQLTCRGWGPDCFEYLQLIRHHWMGSWCLSNCDMNKYSRSVCTESVMHDPTRDICLGNLTRLKLVSQSRCCGWVQVGIDITGPLPRTSAGHVWLVVFVDHLSKQIHLVPLAGNDTSPLSATVLDDAFFDSSSAWPTRRDHLRPGQSVALRLLVRALPPLRYPAQV